MILYHYCNIKTFKDIIKSKCFWLSNLLKSNDKNEVIQTYDILWNNIKNKLLSDFSNHTNIKQNIYDLEQDLKIQNKTSPPFGVCFCKNGDIKEQWLEYGDSTQGISLGFDLSWFDDIQNRVPHVNVSLDNSIGHNEIYYYNV